MSTAQDKILHVIDHEPTAEILAKFWELLNKQPLEAAKVVRALEESSIAIGKIGKEIPEAWERLTEQAVDAQIKRSQFLEDLRTFRSETVGEVASLSESLSALKNSLASIDDAAMNKANRVIEMCERLGKIQRDGTLDTLRKL